MHTCEPSLIFREVPWTISSNIYHFLPNSQNLPYLTKEFSYIFYTFLINLSEMKGKSPSCPFETYHMYEYDVNLKRLSALFVNWHYNFNRDRRKYLIFPLCSVYFRLQTSKAKTEYLHINRVVLNQVVSPQIDFSRGFVFVNSLTFHFFYHQFIKQRKY